jgi:hypothetical protein
MVLKRTLVLGGAILLLAACSDATAPKSQLQTRDGDAAAAAKGGNSKKNAPNAATGVGPTISPTDGGDGECRNGYYVRSGDRDICIDFIQ